MYKLLNKNIIVIILIMIILLCSTITSSAAVYKETIILGSNDIFTSIYDYGTYVMDEEQGIFLDETNIIWAYIDLGKQIIELNNNDITTDDIATTQYYEEDKIVKDDGSLYKYYIVEEYSTTFDIYYGDDLGDIKLRDIGECYVTGTSNSLVAIDVDLSSKDRKIHFNDNDDFKQFQVNINNLNSWGNDLVEYTKRYQGIRNSGNFAPNHVTQTYGFTVIDSDGFCYGKYSPTVRPLAENYWDIPEWVINNEDYFVNGSDVLRSAEFGHQEIYNRFINQVQLQRSNFINNPSFWIFQQTEKNFNLPEKKDWEGYVIAKKIIDEENMLENEYYIYTVDEEELVNGKLLHKDVYVNNDNCNSYMYKGIDLVKYDDNYLTTHDIGIPYRDLPFNDADIIYSTFDIVDEQDNYIIQGDYDANLYGTDTGAELSNKLISTVKAIVIPDTNYIKSKIDETGNLFESKFNFNPNSVDNLKNLTSNEVDMNIPINIMGTNSNLDISIIKDYAYYSRMIFKGIMSIVMFIFLYNNVMLLIKSVKPINVNNSEVK